MNIKQIRKDTPGVQHLIHFNNAGTSFPTQSTLDTSIDYLQREAIVGGYRMKDQSLDQVQDFYNRAAQLINASPDEIALSGSASEAFNKILFSIPFKKGDVIVTTELEYGNSFLNYIHLKNTKGIEIKIIKNLANGDFDLAAFKSAINDQVKLIAVAHIPTSSGAVMPVEAIGEIAKANNILYLVDACQSIGQMPFDVEKVGCDFASATSGKYLRGPRGLGFLYVNKKVLPQLFPPNFDSVTAHWRSDQKVDLEKSALMFENWEKSYAMVFGLSEAIQYLLDLGIENTWARIQELAGYTRENLVAISGVEVHDYGTEKCGIVTFTKEGISPDKIRAALIEKNINVTLSLPFNSLTYMNNRGLDAVVRASVHYFNTKEEIDKMLEIVAIIKE